MSLRKRSISTVVRLGARAVIVCGSLSFDHFIMSASCEPCEPLDLEKEWKLLDALTVVNEVIPDVVVHKHRKTETQRVTCSLWCGTNHPAGYLRRPAVMCNQGNVPSNEHAVRALRLKIEAAHGGCLAVAEAARAAAAAPDTRQPAAPFKALMRTARSRQADAAAKAAEKVAAALRAAADVAAAEERQHASGSQQDEERAKRQRAEAADLPFWKPWLEATLPSVATWDVLQWRYRGPSRRRQMSCACVACSSNSATVPVFSECSGENGVEEALSYRKSNVEKCVKIVYEMGQKRPKIFAPAASYRAGSERGLRSHPCTP